MEEKTHVIYFFFFSGILLNGVLRLRLVGPVEASDLWEEVNFTVGAQHD